MKNTIKNRYSRVNNDSHTIKAIQNIWELDESTKFATFVNNERTHTKYVADSLGNIYSIRKAIKLCKPNPQARQYKYYMFQTTSYHRIIAFAFGLLEDMSLDLDVDHKDGDKYNNRLDNLEVMTHTENCKKRSSFNKIYSVYKDDVLLESFDNQKAISTKYPISQGCVSMIIRGIVKTCHGYTVKLEDKQ